MSSIELKPIGKSKPATAPAPPPRHPDATGAQGSLNTAVPGSLGSAYRQAEEKAKAAVHLQEGGLDSISVWGLAASAWYVGLSHQAICG